MKIKNYNLVRKIDEGEIIPEGFSWKQSISGERVQLILRFLNYKMKFYLDLKGQKYEFDMCEKDKDGCPSPLILKQSLSKKQFNLILKSMKGLIVFSEKIKTLKLKKLRIPKKVVLSKQTKDPK